MKGKSHCKVIGAGEWMEMVAKHKNGLDGCKTMHGLHQCSPRGVAACRAVLTKLDDPGAHGDE